MFRTYTLKTPDKDTITGVLDGSNIFDINTQCPFASITTRRLNIYLELINNRIAE